MKSRTQIPTAADRRQGDQVSLMLRVHAFEPGDLGALEAAVLASILGPALLLKGDPVLWGVLLILLPLNALLAAIPGLRFRWSNGWGALVVPLLLLGIPGELVLMEQACRLTGLAPELPVPELSLVIISHLCAMLVLVGRSALPGRELRRLGAAAALWLPLPLSMLACLGWIERYLGSLIAAGEPSSLLGSGLLRLVLMALGLSLFQRWSRRQSAVEVAVARHAP